MVIIEDSSHINLGQITISDQLSMSLVDFLQVTKAFFFPVVDAINLAYYGKRPCPFLFVLRQDVHFGFALHDVDGLLEEDAGWILDEDGPAWKDEVDGRAWPKVGNDEEETATSESLGSFGDTAMEAKFPLSVSCVQNKSIQLLLSV